ncbi:MAG: hypothetical protein GY838_13720 [bacterium]|nr:hypothetical protein [bacterium]
MELKPLAVTVLKEAMDLRNLLQITTPAQLLEKKDAVMRDIDQVGAALMALREAVVEVLREEAERHVAPPYNPVAPDPPGWGQGPKPVSVPVEAPKVSKEKATPSRQTMKAQVKKAVAKARRKR